MQFVNIGTLKSICENEGTRKKKRFIPTLEHSKGLLL